MLKINYKWTPKESDSLPNGNYNAETDFIEVENGYTFSDWLDDNDAPHEKENDTYYILDDDGNRTGEAFLLI